MFVFYLLFGVGHDSWDFSVLLKGTSAVEREEGKNVQVEHILQNFNTSLYVFHVNKKKIIMEFF